MLITQAHLTQNDCYRAAKPLTPRGIMVHSTAVPGAMAAAFLKSWNTAKPGGKSVCVHAFIDNTGVYQTLPWLTRGWHCGSGPKGSGNDTHIGFEICEPKNLSDRDYFAAVWEKSASLCAFLCRSFGLTADSVICHSEGHRLGIASNHADVTHWFPKHGRTMEDFRNEVKKEMERQNPDNTPDAYARGAVEKAVAKGILRGDDRGNLSLHAPVTRQDLIVILDRCGVLEK